MKRLLSLILTLALLLTSGALAYLDPTTGSTEHTHQWVTDDTYPATCTTGGEIYEHCALCWTRRQRSTPALGHSFPPDGWKTIIPPTCTDVGREMNTCTRNNWPDYFPCGYEWWRDIPALGHDWSDWYVVKEAKPGDPGIEERKCNRCGITEQRPYTVEDTEPSPYSLHLDVEVINGKSVYKSGDVAEFKCTVTNTGMLPIYIDNVIMGAPDDIDNETKADPFGYVFEPGESDSVNFQYTLTDDDESAGHAFLTFLSFGHDPDAYDPPSIASNQVPIVLNLDSFGDYDVIVEKREVSEPANGYWYEEGETIEYTVTVTNRFDTPLTDIGVMDYPHNLADDNCYLLGVIPSLGAYESYTFTGITYTVDAMDCATGYFINTAEAGGVYVSAKSPCGNSPLATIEKSEQSAPDNYTYYTEDEVITYRIIVTNTGTQPIYDVTVYDAYVEEAKGDYSDEVGTTPVLQPGERIEYTVTYIVTAADCMLGYTTNQAQAEFEVDSIPGVGQREDGKRHVLYLDSNTVKSPCGGYDENAVHLDASIDDWTGNVVTILCELTNNSDVPVCPEYVWYLAPASAGDSISEPSGGAYIPVGDSFTYTMTYIIAPEDEALGYPIVLEFFARCRPEDHPEKSVYSNSAEVELSIDIGDMELWIEKTETSVPANGSYYVEGETITYLVEVWNCQDYTLYDIDIYDLPNDDESAAQKLDHLDTLAPHGSVKYSFGHEVNADDVSAGEYLNNAKASWYSTEADILEGLEANVIWAECVKSPCGKTEDGVVVRKEVISTPANGAYYVEGETVRYRVIVTNCTEETFPGLGLSDAIGPLYDFYPNLPDWPLFEPGVTCHTDYSYTVTHDDVLMGFIINCARITCMSYDGSLSQFWSNSVEVPTGEQEPEPDTVILEKREVSTPDNGYAYTVGEQVIYEVTVTNAYHTAVVKVEVRDPLLGEGEESVIGYIETLAMGESYSYLYVYTVTEEDTAVGYVLNQAFVWWTDARTQDMHVDGSNIVTVPVMQSPPPQPMYDVYVNKYVVNPPANGAYYIEGELITYGIYLVNNSTDPVANVIFFDNLYDTNWVGDNKIGGIYTVEPGTTSPTVFFDYPVQAADVDAGYVFNQACSFWSPVNVPADEGFSTWSNTVTVPTGKPDPEPDEVTFQFSKKVVSTSFDPNFYAEGETIDYLITFVNTSDYPMYAAHTWDDLSNDDAFIWNGDLGSWSVDPHSSHTIPYSHTVTKEDVESGKVTNFVQLDLYAAVDEQEWLYFTPWDYVTVDTGIPPIPPEPTPRTYPIAKKYETSTPNNGSYYVEGEDVEYDIVVLNYTGRKFTDLTGYDILLDTPGFVWGALPDLDTAPVTFHVVYKVDYTDVLLKSILNFGWITMYDEEYGEYITVYTDEVVVPTDGTVPPDHPKGRSVCDYTLTASGEGADELMNVYCSEHGAVHAAQAKLMEEAGTDEAKKNASAMGVTLWQRALESQYKRLIEAAQDEKKQALENDRSVFGAYISAYKARLEAQGLDEESVNALVADALCDRVCELCYTAGTAPQARKDVKTDKTPQIQRRAAEICIFELDTSDAAKFTKSLNVCDSHLPMIRAIDRLFAAAGGDESVLSIAWDKAAAYWTASMDGHYETLKREAEGELKYALTLERAAYLALVKARTSLYQAFYPEGEYAKELAARMIEEKALSLCH
ncbi:MAG: hypothetical protein II912_10660 [Clostridia bacterium]|nr:hypothetical protein [Clostridia bacterium]